MQIDHVLLGVRDVDEAAARLLERFGLASVDGGRHPGWGTGNRIVPLGDCYLELIGVVDRAEASANPFGQWLADAVRHGDRFVGWCLAVEDIEAVAARVGTPAVAGSRARPDGVVLTWRLAGLERALAEPGLPFFIGWDDPAGHPGLASAEHRIPARGITWVEVAIDRGRLTDWLGGADVPVRIADGERGVHGVALDVDGRDALVIRADPASAPAQARAD